MTEDEKEVVLKRLKVYVKKQKLGKSNMRFKKRNKREKIQMRMESGGNSDS